MQYYRRFNVDACNVAHDNDRLYINTRINFQARDLQIHQILTCLAEHLQSVLKNIFIWFYLFIIDQFLT